MVEAAIFHLNIIKTVLYAEKPLCMPLEGASHRFVFLLAFLANSL